jgi:DEAD/DEAH box helicase domain-containing protein
MAQRMAIVQTGKYHIWSLSWHDVENKFKTQKSFFEDYLDPVGLPSGGNFKPLLEGYGLARFKNHIKYNSFDLLIHFLENPDEEKWRQFMFVAALMHVDPSPFKVKKYQSNY